MQDRFDSQNLLEVVVSREGSRSTIRLSGELDIASAPLFTDVLEAEQQSADQALIDLGSLTFADSTGLRALVQAARRAGEEGANLLMTRPTGEVARLLELTGLDLALPFESEPA